MRFFAALTAVLLCTPAAIAQEEGDGASPSSTPTFVVVTSKGRGAPNLRRPVQRQLEKKLASYGEQVPFAKYNRAARKAKVKRRAIAEISTAQAVGPGLGLTHVIVIESVREREKVGRRKKNVFYAEVTVVEVATGEVKLTQRFALKGRRLNGPTADEMAQAIGPTLAAPEPEAESEPEPEPESEPEIAVAPPPPPPLAEGEGQEGEGEGAEGSEEPELAALEEPAPESEAEPAPEPAPEPDPEPAGESKPSSSPFEVVTVNETDSQDSSEASSDDRKPGLELSAGPAFLSRAGSVTPSSGEDPVEYTGPLLGAALNLRIFPMALAGDDSALAGLGLVASGFFTQVSTEYDPNDPDATVSSTVLSGEGGLAYRIPFGEGADAPDVTLAVGYAAWQFPLSEGFFPGVKYDGFYAQVGATVPIIEQFAFLAEFGVVPSLNTDGRTKRLGELDGGLGLDAEAGVSFSFAPFNVRLLGHFRQYTASYTGTSTLQLPDEFTDSELTDRYFGGSLQVGVSF